MTYEALEELIDNGQASLQKGLMPFQQMNIPILVNNVAQTPLISQFITIPSNQASVINQASMVFELQITTSANGISPLLMVPNAIYSMIQNFEFRTNKFDLNYTSQTINKSLPLFVNANTACQAALQEILLFGELYNENFIPITSDCLTDITIQQNNGTEAGTVNAYNSRFLTNNQETIIALTAANPSVVQSAQANGIQINQNTNKEYVSGITYNNGRKFDFKQSTTKVFYYRLFLQKAMFILDSMNLLSGSINFNINILPNINTMFQINDAVPSVATMNFDIKKMWLEQDIINFHRVESPIDYNFTKLTSMNMKELTYPNASYQLTLTNTGGLWSYAPGTFQMTVNSPLTQNQNLKLFLFPYISNITFNGITQDLYYNWMTSIKTCPDNGWTNAYTPPSYARMYNGTCLNNLFRIGQSYTQYGNVQKPYNVLYNPGLTNIDASLPYYYSSLVNFSGIANDGSATNSCISPEMYNRYMQFLAIDLEELTANNKAQVQLTNVVTIQGNPDIPNLLQGLGANGNTITFTISLISMNTYIAVYSE